MALERPGEGGMGLAAMERKGVARRAGDRSGSIGVDCHGMDGTGSRGPGWRGPD